jgi:hypothetical protein
MSQSFHAGLSTSAHRRRTDLMPTITPSAMAGSTAGTRTPSRVGTANDGSRASTPGNKMLRSANPGRTVSMSRLDSLSKSRVLVPPHASHPHKRTPVKKPGLPPNGPTVKHSTSKSVSLVQLNCPSTDRRSSIDRNPDSMTRSVTINTRSVSNRSGKFQLS